MSDKPFKSYEELISKLRDEKKLTIKQEDEEFVVSLLKKYSYFSLVSGYKSIFKAPDGTYLPGTTINDILALYEFDDTLRDVFFHAIQIIEKNIKSLLSYSFTKEYGEAQIQYVTPANYDTLSSILLCCFFFLLHAKEHPIKNFSNIQREFLRVDAREGRADWTE